MKLSIADLLTASLKGRTLDVTGWRKEWPSVTITNVVVDADGSIVFYYPGGHIKATPLMLSVMAFEQTGSPGAMKVESPSPAAPMKEVAPVKESKKEKESKK